MLLSTTETEHRDAVIINDRRRGDTKAIISLVGSPIEGNNTDIHKLPTSRTSRKDLNIVPPEERTSSGVAMRFTTTSLEVLIGHLVLRANHEPVLIEGKMNAT